MSLRYLGLILLLACTGEIVDDDVATPCPAPGAPRAVATGLTGGTEGIAVLQGEVYVGHGDRVVRIREDGGVDEVAAVPAVVGLAAWRGALWAASWEDEAGDEAASLVEIDPAGGVVRHPIAAPLRPNFLLATPWDTLLVSDDFDTRIFEYAGGESAVWATDLTSPNGLGLSPDGGTLYVANTFGLSTPLVAIAVADGAAAGAPEVLRDYGPGTTPDGLLVGGEGAVLVALNLAGELSTWDGQAATTVVDGLSTPASLAWSPTGDCEVVVTSLFGDSVWALGVGVR